MGCAPSRELAVASSARGGPETTVAEESAKMAATNCAISENRQPQQPF